MSSGKRPNILLLFTDEQRWDAMGCAGNDVLHTPHLDRLAASGVRFSQACTSTPICVAARHSLVTGHRGSRTHWVDNGKLPGPEPVLPTMMTMLHGEGYYNHAVGKLHFQGRHFGLHSIDSMEECPGVRVDDDYLLYLREQGVRTQAPHGLRDLLYFQPQSCTVPEEHSPNRWVADRSIDFLQGHAKHRGKQPFFLWSSWISPHPPFAPPEPYDTMYDPLRMELPVNRSRPLSTLPSPAWPHRARLDGAHLDNDRIKKLKALYYGLVSQVDHQIGRLLQELDNLGLTENTLVIFASDHGEMLGDHGLCQKMVPYEASVRIPLLVRWPGKTEAGRVCGDPVGLTDLVPTLINELKLEYPGDWSFLTGESVLSKPGGGLASGRKQFVIDYGYGRKRWIAVRSETCKYVYWAAGGYEELYDLAQDPDELNNLAGEQNEKLMEFRRYALDWESKHGLADSLDGNEFKAYAEPGLPAEPLSLVAMNQGAWPKHVPEDESDTIETFAETFTRAIANQPSLSAQKLNIAQYKSKGGDLTGTPWEDEWRFAH
jgi:arylsulfatase